MKPISATILPTISDIICEAPKIIKDGECIDYISLPLQQERQIIIRIELGNGAVMISILFLLITFFSLAACVNSCRKKKVDPFKPMTTEN